MTITEDNGKSTFTLHGVELRGSFDLHFTKGKWQIRNFQFQETKISGTDLKKLANASKEKKDVVLKLKNGEGKAKIISLYYVPTSGTLWDISINLVKWNVS